MEPLATLDRVDHAVGGEQLAGVGAADDAVYRDGDYFGTHVNLAHRVVSRAHAGELLATDGVVEAIEGRERLRAEPIGEVTLKGFGEATELFLAGLR